MWSKLFLKEPPVFTVLAVVLLVGFVMSREASFKEVLPASSFVSQNFVYVEVSGDALKPGVYQFNDGSTYLDVIKLTNGDDDDNSFNNSQWSQRLQSGEILVVDKKDRRIDILRNGWMSASKRMALAIPLHPDRMSSKDWTALPGIGDVLATRIGLDRQKNGDFGEFRQLKRVKGIGEKRIKSWESFF
jgi:competence protein ComEA